MKVTNYQLKLIIPILINAAREKPDVELDVLLDRLVEMARHRGMTMTRLTGVDPLDMNGLVRETEESRPERALTTGRVGSMTPGQGETQPGGVHPLFREPVKKAAKRRGTAA